MEPPEKGTRILMTTPRPVKPEFELIIRLGPNNGYVLATSFTFYTLLARAQGKQSSSRAQLWLRVAGNGFGTSLVDRFPTGSQQLDY